jgi:DNA primase
MAHKARAAPDRPTWALVDIDPGPRTSWDETLLLARLYRTALAHVGLRGFPKLTGQRGIQVWIPVKPIYTFDQTRDWVATLSRTIAAAAPNLISWEWEKSRRDGLARLDYTQNAWNKTLVAPYSVRPVAGAAVSAPIDWDELEDPDLRPDRWTVRTIAARIGERGDLFAPALGLEQELSPLPTRLSPGTATMMAADPATSRSGGEALRLRFLEVQELAHSPRQILGRERFGEECGVLAQLSAIDDRLAGVAADE